MSDQVAFLRARLDDDAAAARAAFGETGRWQRTTEPNVLAEGDRTVVWDESAPSDAEFIHIARHDPARVLREVAAKRAIIDEHQRLSAEYLAHGHGLTQAALMAIMMAMDVLAAVYADHPDYDSAWAPRRELSDA